MDARDAGRRPVVVARRRGEAVDDHQLAFAEHLDRYGLAFVASTPDELFDHFLAILANPLIAAVTRASAEPPPGIAGVGGAIDRLVWTT
jgi:UDP-N-acetylglucosamine transferase subunit ALG13